MLALGIFIKSYFNRRISPIMIFNHQIGSVTVPQKKILLKVFQCIIPQPWSGRRSSQSLVFKIINVIDFIFVYTKKTYCKQVEITYHEKTIQPYSLKVIRRYLLEYYTNDGEIGCKSFANRFCTCQVWDVL